MTAVTGCRLVAYVPDAEGEQRFPIHFSDIERVGLDDPSDPSVFSLRSSGGVRWAIPVDATDTVTMVTVLRYVRTGADLYGRAHEATQLVQQRRNDLVTAALDGEDGRVKNLYEGLGDRLEDVRERAEGTPFTEIDTFSETLRLTGRRLDRIHTVALLARIDAVCRADRNSIENGEYEAVAENLGRLTDWYATVRTRVGGSDIDPFADPAAALSPDDVYGGTDGVERRHPSPFDAVEADGAVTIAAERIRALVESLLEHANHQFAAADETQEEDRRIERLESTLAIYSAVLYDSWGSPELVPTQRQQLRYRREETVAQLIDVRCSVAERLAWVGYEALEDEEMSTAIPRFDSALRHLEAAHELAHEFRAGDPAEIAEKWAKLEDARPERVAGVAVRSQ